MDGGDGDDSIDLGAGDDNVTGDEGNDTILPGDGADFAYGEEGSNHIILTSDGAKDLIYCRNERLDSGDGYVTYVGSRSDLDQGIDRLEGCSRVEVVTSLSKALGRDGALRLARGLGPILRVPAPPRF